LAILAVVVAYFLFFYHAFEPDNGCVPPELARVFERCLTLNALGDFLAGVFAPLALLSELTDLRFPFRPLTGTGGC